MKHVALIVGIGPGLGAAIARRFGRGGFRVAIIARTSEFITQLARELSSSGDLALALVADVSQPKEVTAVSVLVHNASSSSGGGLLRTSAAEFEEAWRIAALGAFVCARESAPDMIAAGTGSMIFTGATSSVRGGGWLSFSSAKFALRGLAQSLARELWPQGIHVAHVVVDGLIGPRNAAHKDSPDPLLDPDQMAEAYFQLANQDRSAWTLELDLRANREQFFE